MKKYKLLNLEKFNYYNIALDHFTKEQRKNLHIYIENTFSNIIMGTSSKNRGDSFNYSFELVANNDGYKWMARTENNIDKDKSRSYDWWIMTLRQFSDLPKIIIDNSNIFKKDTMLDKQLKTLNHE